MASFTYTALNDQGKNATGHIDADTPENARNLLAQRGFIPISVKAQQEGESSGFNFKEMLGDVSTADLILFTKQFRTMIHAGIPIMRLLNILEAQTDNPKLEKVVNRIGSDISGGSSLNEAFARHPSVFSKLYISMIKSGETSGALPAILERLIYVIEHDAKVKAEIKSALQYPIIVLAFLGVAFLILLTVVVPNFASMFARVGLELPWPTRVCIFMYEVLSTYYVVILASIAGGIFTIMTYLRTEQGQFVKDSIMLGLPILGPLFVKSAMSRFASILAILQASGVPVLESVNILAGSIGNAAISRQFEMVKKELTSGKGLSEPLESAAYFTPMVVNMIAIGEESGSLDSLLREVAEHYDYEVEYATKQLTDAIGPILMIGLSALVGFFAMAIFLPMWAMIKTV